MQIVAVETSGRHGSVAALSEEAGKPRLLREMELAVDQRTAQTLAPALRQLLMDVRWPPQSIHLVAVAVGPGSFTGLRIGVTTAKTFAYAAGAEVLGVNTLTVLAAQAQPSSEPLWTIIEAQRQELFVAKFNGNIADALAIDCETSIVRQDIWLAQLRPGERVIGPALRRLASKLPAGVVAVEEELWQPMAATVGRVAWHAHRAGRRDNVWKLAPHYYRPSAAEEKMGL
jgi:tRNA threonylcarbamoyladenosine biosynthesis protein TsaB